MTWSRKCKLLLRYDTTMSESRMQFSTNSCRCRSGRDWMTLLGYRASKADKSRYYLRDLYWEHMNVEHAGDVQRDSMSEGQSRSINKMLCSRFSRIKFKVQIGKSYHFSPFSTKSVSRSFFSTLCTVVRIEVDRRVFAVSFFSMNHQS
jgi:hypothetical protein